MLNDHTRSDGLLGDYCDGSFLKNHLYFQTNPNALQLLLYFDEIEVCDPLASHRGQHKLGNIKRQVYKTLFVHNYRYFLL